MKTIGKSILVIVMLLSLLVGCSGKQDEAPKKTNDDILRIASGEWVGIDGYQLDESAAFQQLVGRRKKTRRPVKDWSNCVRKPTV